MRAEFPVALTRRRFLAAVSAGIAAVALDACTPGGDPTSTSAPPPRTAAPTAPMPTAAAPTGNAGAASAPATGAGMATAAGAAAATVRPSAAASAASGTPAPATSGSAVAGATGSAVPATATSGATGQMLVVKAVDYGFQTTGSIPGGLTTIQMQNLGKEPHQAQLARLADGVTYDQFVAAVKADIMSGSGTSEKMVVPVGGPNVGMSGATIEVIQDLKAGQYVLLCFIPNAMGTPHVALGMSLPLTVTAPTAPAAMAPAVKGTITLKDDNFDIATFPSGRSLYRVVNGGTEPADLQVLRVAPGKTVEDVKQYAIALGTDKAAPGPAPATGGGGIATLAPGESGIIVLDLAPGPYAVWTRDPSTGVAEFMVS